MTLPCISPSAAFVENLPRKWGFAPIYVVGSIVTIWFTFFVLVVQILLENTGLHAPGSKNSTRLLPSRTASPCYFLHPGGILSVKRSYPVAEEERQLLVKRCVAHNQALKPPSIIRLAPVTKPASDPAR